MYYLSASSIPLGNYLITKIASQKSSAVNFLFGNGVYKCPLQKENIIIEKIQKNKMYRNPFYLGWNKGWSFLFFLEGGIAKIEAKGFGISITTKVEKGESPLESADRLVSKEQRIRKSRYYSWLRSINEKQ